MDKKIIIKTGLGVVVGALLAGGTAIFAQKFVGGQEEAYSKAKLSFINSIVGTNYITQASQEEMMEGIYQGYVYGLEDSETAYLTKEQYNKKKVETGGAYYGTGIEFVWGISNQYIVVTEVIPGSPAEEAGIQVGDKIIEIDGIKAMMSNEVEIYDKLTYTGDQGVKYLVTDNEGNNKREVSLLSRVIDRVLISSELMGRDIGYIKLEGLKNGTSKQIKQHLDELKEQGAKKFVLDLRGAYSDNVEEVQALSDIFLAEGVAFTVEDKKQSIQEYKLDSDYMNEPMAVITNRYTSGALEAFVGAIKDLGRGQIIGEKTAGTGTVQELVELEDGSGLLITSGLIETPNGHLIKDNGIEPDFLERTPTSNTIELVTTGQVKKENDAQLQKAIQILR